MGRHLDAYTGDMADRLMMFGTIVLGTVLIAGAGVVWVSLRGMWGERRSRALVLGCLRAAAIGALAMAIISPAFRATIERIVPARLTVFIDTSRSMSIEDAAGGNSRLEAARAVRDELVRRLGERDEPPAVEYTCGHAGVEMCMDGGEVAADGGTTDLRSIVRQLATEWGSGEVVVISDGADTGHSRLQMLGQSAVTAGARMSGVGVGSAAGLADIAVEAVRAPRQVRAHSDFELQATVRVRGFEGEQLPGRVLREGKAIRSLDIAGGERAQRLRVQLTAPGPGQYRYSVDMAAHAVEVVRSNNLKSVVVRVTAEKPEVVLIGGAPSVEYASVKRVVLGDERIDGRAGVRKTEGDGLWRDDTQYRRAGVSELLPREPSGAVIIADMPLAALSGVRERLAEFVREGGGVAILGGVRLAEAGGGDAAGIGELLPVRLGDGGYVDEIVEARLTDAESTLGKALRDAGIDFGALRAWRGRNLVGAVKPGAETVLSADGEPLLVCGSAGEGRTLFLATDTTHRWIFNPDAGDRERTAFNGFWGAIIDWLTQPQDLRGVVAEFDQEQYEAGEPARLLVQLADDTGRAIEDGEVTARISSPEGTYEVTCEASKTAEGRYETFIPTKGAGRLTAEVTGERLGKKLGSDSAEAKVVQVDSELVEGRANYEVLRELASRTGGAFSAGSVRGMEDELRLGADRVPTPVTREPARSPWTMILLIVLWGADWVLRRRWL